MFHKAIHLIIMNMSTKTEILCSQWFLSALHPFYAWQQYCSDISLQNFAKSMKCHRHHHPTPINVKLKCSCKNSHFSSIRVLMIMFKKWMWKQKYKVTFFNIICGFSKCFSFRYYCWCVGSLFQTDVNDLSVRVDILHRPISMQRLVKLRNGSRQ